MKLINDNLIKSLFERKKIEIEDSSIKGFLEKTHAKIETLQWKYLLKEFEDITGSNLLTKLEEHKKGLKTDLEYLFKFRNFFSHSNSLSLDNNFNFKNKTKTNDLYRYISSKKLVNEELPEGSYRLHIEKIVTGQLVLQFRENVLVDFIDFGEWKKDYETMNAISFIRR